jgi:hypothetical protein
MLGLTSVALTVLFVFPAGSPAAAQPPITVAQAKALIEQLQMTRPASTSSTPVSGSKSRKAGRNFG